MSKPKKMRKRIVWAYWDDKWDELVVVPGNKRPQRAPEDWCWEVDASRLFSKEGEARDVFRLTGADFKDKNPRRLRITTEFL